MEKLPPPSPDVEELREKAEASRDALINTIMDPKAKKKAGILADAALTGVMVTKIEVLATAENGDLACNFVLQSSGIDARLAVCEAAMATSVSRRLLSVPNFIFDIDLITSVASVTREDIETAIVKLISSGLSPTMSELDPVAELKSLPGVDDAAVSQFAKDAYDLNLVSGTDGSDGSAEVNININEGGGNGDDPDVLITTVVGVGVAALVCFGGMCACYARHRTNARFLMDLDTVKELLPNSMQDKLLTGERSSSLGSRKSFRSESLKLVGISSGAQDRARDTINATADYLDSLEMEVRQLRSLSMQYGFEATPSQLQKTGGNSTTGVAGEPSLPRENDGVHTKQIRITFADGDVMDVPNPNGAGTPSRSLFNAFGAFGR